MGESGTKRRWLTQLALLAVVTLVCFVALELLVRAFIPVRNVGASFSQYDPYYGKALKPSFETVRITPDFTMSFSTNEHGRRGDERSSPAGGVVFVGDSFTMGYGVDDGEEFPAIVRENIAERVGRPVPVVNAGMGNNGNGRWLKFLERDAPPLAPKLVVLQICDNDFFDNQQEHLFSLSPDGTLVGHDVPPPGMKRKIQTVVEALPFVADSYLMGLAQQLARPAPPPGLVATSTSVPTDVLTYRLIERALKMCREKGWPVLGLTAQVSGVRGDRIRGLFERFGADVIRVPVKTERPDLYFELDGHWSAAGHAYVAERVLTWLGEHRELFE